MFVSARAEPYNTLIYIVAKHKHKNMNMNMVMGESERRVVKKSKRVIYVCFVCF